jgi:single-strand DNA-binding protein
LKNRQWEQDGIKRYSTEIQVSEMTFLSTKKNDENAKNSQTAVNPSTIAEKSTTSEEDDLPF